MSYKSKRWEINISIAKYIFSVNMWKKNLKGEEVEMVLNGPNEVGRRKRNCSKDFWLNVTCHEGSRNGEMFIFPTCIQEFLYGSRIALALFRTEMQRA